MEHSRMVKVIRIKDGCLLNIAEFIFLDYPNRFRLVNEEDKELYKDGTAPKIAKVSSKAPAETSPAHKKMMAKVAAAKKELEEADVVMIDEDFPTDLPGLTRPEIKEDEEE